MRKLFLVLSLVMLMTLLQAETVNAQSGSTLVGIRAASHGYYDRVVFDFNGALPTKHEVKYVSQLIGDASGQVIPIAGKFILQVRFEPSAAHNDAGQSTAPADLKFNLGNVVEVKRAGDFEGVVTYGIGLKKQALFCPFSLSGPTRFVVDIAS